MLTSMRCRGSLFGQFLGSSQARLSVLSRKHWTIDLGKDLIRTAALGEGKSLVFNPHHPSPPLSPHACWRVTMVSMDLVAAYLRVAASAIGLYECVSLPRGSQAKITDCLNLCIYVPTLGILSRSLLSIGSIGMRGRAGD